MNSLILGFAIRTFFATFGALISICFFFSLQIPICFCWFGFLLGLLSIFIDPPDLTFHVWRCARHLPFFTFAFQQFPSSSPYVGLAALANRLKGGSSCVKRCLLILAGTKLHALRSFRVGSCAIALQATLANDFPFAEDAFVPFGLFGNIPPPLDLHGLLATQALIAGSSYRKFLLSQVRRLIRQSPLRTVLVTLVGFCAIGFVTVGNYSGKTMPPSPTGYTHFHLEHENLVRDGKPESPRASTVNLFVIDAGDSIRSTLDYSSDYSELQPEDGNFASSLDIGGGSRLPFRRGVVDVPLGEEHDFEYSFTLSKTADVSKHYPIMYSDVIPRNNYVLSSTDFQSSLTNSTYDCAQHCKYGVCARLETGPPLICACSAGMTGKDCDTCADNFYDFPLCTYCDAAVTCSGHGVCKAQLGLSGGGCVCETGYTGKDCSSCAADFFSYPLCLPCTSADTRSGHGSCLILRFQTSPN